MRMIGFVLLGSMVAVAGCKPGAGFGGSTPTRSEMLADARKGFQPKIVPQRGQRDRVDQPPGNLLRLVRYDSPVGKLAAYLTPDPKDGKKRPAIVWITGGDCNSIGDVWSPAPAKNDQTAAAYRQAGIVMMFPSLRGGNDNPGQKEGYFGEVDDVLAAAKYLAQQPHVDPRRIYLGGHSTGGTLVLLVSEYSDVFRAVFSFGPVEDPRGYGPEYTPFDTSNPRECELRAPGLWLASIKSPTFVFEGSNGNIESLKEMARVNSNPKVQFFPIRGADHFSILAPMNRLIAEKMLRDTGPTCNLSFATEELARVAK